MILVTGASGFIGTALCVMLITQQSSVRAVSRSGEVPGEVTEHVRLDLESSDDLDTLCAGVDTIVHLAGRAHILNDKSDDPVTAFNNANVHVVTKLAEAAIQQRVRRFIFLSSIGVIGSETSEGEEFSENSICLPSQHYAVSKKNAERELIQLAKDGNMELVIIRPPLVYAGGAPGNFRRLMSLVRSGIPLPLLSVDNRRSMIALENLIDFIQTCIRHPLAANQTFVISDGKDLATPQIIQLLADGMGRPHRLFAFPVSLIGIGFSVINRKAMYSQLCKSLVVSSTKARLLLGWTAPVSPEKALAAAGRDFVSRYDDNLGG